METILAQEDQDYQDSMVVTCVIVVEPVIDVTLFDLELSRTVMRINVTVNENSIEDVPMVVEAIGSIVLNLDSLAI